MGTRVLRSKGKGFQFTSIELLFFIWLSLTLLLSLLYLKEAGWADVGRVIACTQPRRLAVQAAEEMGVKLGEKVGYTPDLTGIKFLTDGILLREMMDDPLLTKYSKRRRVTEGDELRPRLEPAILSVEGRGFNVQFHYVEDAVQDYVQASVSTVLLIHDQEPAGDILVFLTGQDDIDVAIKLLTEEARSNGKTSSGLIILPLYSGLSRAEQDLVFSPTNIAETSLTLEISDIENLVVAPISKASARQRAGRAGRLRPGKCYRCLVISRNCIHEHFVNEMSVQGIPEIQRSNLVSCVIQLKALGIDNILGFDWPASPSPESMIRALEVLYHLGVLDDDDAKLTSPVGFQVAEIPLEPMISKMILASNELGCSEEIITIAAVLSIQSIWFSGRGAQKELDEAKLRFAAAEIL
ncbi:hypothetical protein REPUB_Repub13aG0236400 [Reevesia pubescens]